jgi:CelD/BcsL family acetyltransferase involved in cellulose biosynthesis
MRSVTTDMASSSLRARMLRLALNGPVSVSSTTIDQWERAWQADPSATYYQSPAWSQLWAKLTPATNLAAMTLRLGSSTSVVVPLLQQRAYRGLVRHYVSNPSGSQTGWLAPASLNDSEAQQVVCHLLSQLPDLDWRTSPLQHRDRLPTPSAVDHSQLVDLRSGPHAIRANWSKGHKAAYTQGTKAGVEVRVADSESEWQRFYELYLDSIRRWRASGEPVTSIYGRALFDGLRSAPEVRLWVAERDGEMLSAAVFLYASKTVTYYHGATDEKAFALRPSNVLLGEVMMRAAAEGKEWVDLGASGGHEKVAAFKRRFGAVAAPFGIFRSTSRRRRFLRAIRTSPARLQRA